jgi:hypothetical protein
VRRFELELIHIYAELTARGVRFHVAPEDFPVDLVGDVPHLWGKHHPQRGCEGRKCPAGPIRSRP